MTINLQLPDITELKPRITVFGVGGAGGNAVNNMIESGLDGCDFVVANTDAQALTMSKSERLVQMGVLATEGLGAGSQPEVGAAAAEEVIDEIKDHLSGSHMVFVTAGMGGGTGTGSAPVIARAASEAGILTVGVVTKPFQFEGQHRMRIADDGIKMLEEHVDTLIVIPNQNLFRIANENTTFADAFSMADEVLYSGVACITDLMVKEGLINLDFADVRAVMRNMGKAMMGTGDATGENRARQAAECAIANPLLDESSMHGAKGLLISITGGSDLTLFEVDEAANRIRDEVDSDANIILGATFDENLNGTVRVSVVATGIEAGTQSGYSDAPVRHSLITPQKEAAASANPAPIEETVDLPNPFATNDLETQINNALSEITQEKIDNIPSASPSMRNENSAEMSITDSDTEPHLKPGTVADMKAWNDDLALGEAELISPPMAEISQPESNDLRLPKLPSVEDFPPIVKDELHADIGSGEQVNDRQPLGLLRRLAAGMGAQTEETNSTEEETVQQQAQSPAPQARRIPDSATAANAGDLDNLGRQQTAPKLADDDHLEIPAFLRRQAR